MKEFADNDSKFDENLTKFSNQVENTVGKGEIARYEQFLLFPQCFEKTCFPGASKGVFVWERVKTWDSVVMDELKYQINPQHISSPEKDPASFLLHQWRPLLCRPFLICTEQMQQL